MRSDKLPDQIVDSIYSPELNEIGYDIAEIAFDSLLDDGILKDLPIIGTIVKVFKGAMDIRDRIFIVKVARFLFHLTGTPFEHRQSFKQKINEEPKLKRRLGESLVLLLDRLDDLEKTDFMAKCFAAYLAGNISFDQFRRLAVALDMAFVDDLKTICRDNVEEEEGIYLANLSRTGLVEFRASGVEGTWNEMGTIRYSLSPLGRLFVDIMVSRAL